MSVEDDSLFGLGMSATTIYIIAGATAAVLLGIILTSVFLTLPNSFSCQPDDESYYVKLVDEPAVASLIPSILCLPAGARSAIVRSGESPLNAESTEDKCKTCSFVAFGEGAEFTPRVSLVWGEKEVLFPTKDVGTSDAVELGVYRDDTVVVFESLGAVVPEVKKIHSANHSQPFYEAEVAVELLQPSDPGMGSLDAFSSKGCRGAYSQVAYVIDLPRIEGRPPIAVCSDESVDVETIIQGSGFFTHQVDGASSRPTFALYASEGADPVPVASLTVQGNCSDIPAADFTEARVCDELKVTMSGALLADSLGSQHGTAVVTNPTAVGGSTGTGVLDLYIHDAPTITLVEPRLLCNAFGDATFTVTGSDFIRFRAPAGSSTINPSVTLGGAALSQVTLSGCTDATPNASIWTTGYKVEECTSIEVVVPSSFALGEGVHELRVSLPTLSGAQATKCAAAAVPMAILAPMEIDASSRPVECVGPDVDTANVELTGTFYRTNGVNPTLNIGDDSVLLLLSNCGPEDADAGVVVETCTTASFTAPRSLTAGGLQVSPTMLPDGGSFFTCPGQQPAQDVMGFLPGMTVSNLPFPAVCESGFVATDQAIVFSGDWFVSFTDNGLGSASVTRALLNDVQMSANAVALSSEGDSTPLSSNLTVTGTSDTMAIVSLSTAADFAINPAVGDTFTLQLDSPSPLSCTADEATLLTMLVVEEPSVSSVDHPTNDFICARKDDQFVVTGTLAVGTADGTNVAPIGTSRYSFANVVGTSGCSGASCSEATVTLTDADVAELPFGDSDIRVTVNEQCRSTTEVLTVMPVPTIESVTPARICRNVASTITLTGTNFVQTSSGSQFPQIKVGGELPKIGAAMTGPLTNHPSDSGNVANMRTGSTLVSAEFPADSLSQSADAPIVVTNQDGTATDDVAFDGCSATSPANSLEIVDVPTLRAITEGGEVDPTTQGMFPVDVCAANAFTVTFSSVVVSPTNTAFFQVILSSPTANYTIVDEGQPTDGNVWGVLQAGGTSDSFVVVGVPGKVDDGEYDVIVSNTLDDECSTTLVRTGGSISTTKAFRSNCPSPCGYNDAFPCT